MVAIVFTGPSCYEVGSEMRHGAAGGRSRSAVNRYRRNFEPDFHATDMASETLKGGKSVAVRLRVPFHDLDPLHVVWHGNYLKYFDIARFALFEEAGIDLYRYSLDQRIIFPITRFSMKNIVALRHNDAFTCRAVVTEARYKIAMSFDIRRDRDGIVCTRATSEQLAVQLPDMEMQFEIPADICSALGFDHAP